MKAGDYVCNADFIGEISLYAIWQVLEDPDNDLATVLCKNIKTNVKYPKLKNSVKELSIKQVVYLKLQGLI